MDESGDYSITVSRYVLRKDGKGSVLLTADPVIVCVAAEAPRKSYLAQDVVVAKGAEDRDDTRVVPYDGGTGNVLVRTPGVQVRVVPTELVQTSYTGTLINVSKPGNPPRRRTWNLYQLRSTDKLSDYTWYMWSDYILGRFNLFGASDGHTYLSWVQLSTVGIADVSAPIAAALKLTKLNDMLDGRQTGIVCIPVDLLLDKRLFVDSDTHSHFLSIYVTSIQTNENGYVVQLHGRDPDKTYTFVTDAKSSLGWRLRE